MRLVQKGRGQGGQKIARRDLGYGILFLPSLIRLELQSWTTVWNQPLPVPGTRVPGKVPELRVPGTRVQGKVPGSANPFGFRGRQGSGIPRFSAPGRFRAHLAFGKVPETLPWFRAVLESPEHQFWNILETQSLGNEDSGKVPATLGSDKVPRTTADADPQFGYTSWIMSQVPDRDKVTEQ